VKHRLLRLWSWIDAPLRAPLVRRWPASRPAGVAVAVLAAGLVTFDMIAPFGFDRWWARAVPLAVALPLYGFLTGWDRTSLGLRFSPVQGWWWWVRTGLVLGAVVLAVVGLAGGIGLLAGRPLPPPIVQPWRDWAQWLFDGCVRAPLLEESTYRFVLCLPLLALCGRWPALLASGVVFAALHVRYGIPSPDNFAGGFVFAWGFLASGSLLVPMLLHAAGNLFVVASHLVYAWACAAGLFSGA
jgi:membrane protease YdiL (CAAX protease family)